MKDDNDTEICFRLPAQWKMGGNSALNIFGWGAIAYCIRN